jgi:uncharacterized protein YodC (DUF2158 family)
MSYSDVRFSHTYWQIKPGDVVQIKSGGPRMTVASVSDLDGLPTVVCEWFDDRRSANKGTFALSSVAKVGRIERLRSS